MKTEALYSLQHHSIGDSLHHNSSYFDPIAADRPHRFVEVYNIAHDTKFELGGDEPLGCDEPRENAKRAETKRRAAAPRRTLRGRAGMLWGPKWTVLFERRGVFERLEECQKGKSTRRPRSL